MILMLIWSELCEYHVLVVGIATALGAIGGYPVHHSHRTIFYDKTYTEGIIQPSIQFALPAPH